MSTSAFYFLLGLFWGVVGSHFYDQWRRRSYRELIGKCEALLAELNEVLELIQKAKS